MPIFEYVCEKCKESTEIIVAFSDPRPESIPCPECGADAHFEFAPCCRNAWSWGIWSGNYIDNYADTKKHMGKPFAEMLHKAQGFDKNDKD